MTNPHEHRAVGNVVNEAARREVRQAQRIHELEAQVTRLQQALIDHVADWSFGMPDDDPKRLRDEVQLWLDKNGYLTNWHDLDQVEGGEDE